MDGESEAAIKEAYASLNAAQKEAVDTIEGPVMVIAGPGTGKTQILTLRIANILLKTDTKPENILALTFTDSGAKAMRERLQSLIGEAAYGVGIYTFHGFADSLIKRYPEAYPNVIGGRAVSDIERIRIVEQALEDTTYKALRPGGDPSFYVQPILRAIQTLKQEYLTPDRFADSINEQEKALSEIEQYHTKGAHKGKERGDYKDALKYLDRNRELLIIYRQYDSSLRADKLYDFDDMIIQTVAALSENEEMLRDIQEQFHYVLADEHQDVNGSQNKILEQIVSFHDQPNLFVVGDEKQAIYRFQGASLDNFLYFESTFGKTKTISLTDNYRSGQTVLDAAQDLIKTDNPALAPLRVPLEAKVVGESAVELHEFAHQAVEDSYLIEEIKKDIESGISPQEIAVILRTNREVEAVAVALRKQGIAAAPSADSDVLDHPITSRIHILIKAVANPADEVVLYRLLHEPYWKIPLSDLILVLKTINRKTPLSSLLRDTKQLEEIGVAEVGKVLQIGKLLDEVKEKSVTKPPHRLLETLLSESGFSDHVLTHDPYDGARIIRRVYDEVESMVRRGEVGSLADIASQLDLHRQYGIALNAPFIPFTESAVQVMTAHKSKGLEFEHVYIPHLNDRTWGAKKGRELFKLPIVKHDTSDFDTAEDDERRLLYVAMTRAKVKLACLVSELNPDGKEQTMSRFLTGLDAGLIKSVDISTYSENFSPVSDLVTVEPLSVTTDLVLEALSNRGFSPTALNNYLKSPWEYLYRNVLRAPQIKSTELQFGSAVHAVLDEVVRHHLNNEENVVLGKVSDLLRQGLGKEAVSEEEFSRLHERGLESLSVYVPQLLNRANNSSKTEMQLEATIETGLTEYPVLKLNGNLDRVDVDDSGAIIRVVDYKTGKPKTRNHIEGKTASSTGDYKRQLVFYAMLLSLQSDQNKHCRIGVLSFVEADKNGVIKEEVFEVTDEEIEELKSELISVVKEVVSGEMFKGTCDPETCHYCDLVEAWRVG